MNGHGVAQIDCPIQNKPVRALTVVGDSVEIDAMTHKLTVPLDTAIFYEPWVMDRGNMLFSNSGRKWKICTEMDIIRFPDNSAYSVHPAI
jgi:hypothetical protein